MDHQRSSEHSGREKSQALVRLIPWHSLAPPPDLVRGRGLQNRRRRTLCNSCFRKFPRAKLVACYCWHNYCHKCVVEMVDAALAVDFMLPIRCCEMMIPLEWEVLKIPQETADAYDRRAIEVEARGVVYCYQNGCRAPIHPQFIIHQEAICGKCLSSTCARCRGAFHRGLDCGDLQTPDDQRLHDLAATYGWGKCYECNSYIQLNPGRNHLLCLCGAETCFSCGKTWQACDCIRPNRNAVTDELGRAVQAQSDDDRQLDPIPQGLRRPLDEARMEAYENYLTERLERHLAEVKRIRTGIGAITSSKGLMRPERCSHERWVLHEVRYDYCDLCGQQSTAGWARSCMYCLIHVCINCKDAADDGNGQDGEQDRQSEQNGEQSVQDGQQNGQNDERSEQSEQSFEQNIEQNIKKNIEQNIEQIIQQIIQQNIEQNVEQNGEQNEQSEQIEQKEQSEQNREQNEQNGEQNRQIKHIKQIKQNEQNSKQSKQNKGGRKERARKMLERSKLQKQMKRDKRSKQTQTKQTEQTKSMRKRCILNRPRKQEKLELWNKQVQTEWTEQTQKTKPPQEVTQTQEPEKTEQTEQTQQTQQNNSMRERCKLKLEKLEKLEPRNKQTQTRETWQPKRVEQPELTRETEPGEQTEETKQNKQPEPTESTEQRITQSKEIAQTERSEQAEENMQSKQSEDSEENEQTEQN